MSSYLLFCRSIYFSMFGTSYIIWCPNEKKLWNLHTRYRVIVEVLVLGLLVVVYQGIRFRIAVVCEPGKM